MTVYTLPFGTGHWVLRGQYVFFTDKGLANGIHEFDRKVQSCDDTQPVNNDVTKEYFSDVTGCYLTDQAEYHLE